MAVSRQPLTKSDRCSHPEGALWTIIRGRTLKRYGLPKRSNSTVRIEYAVPRKKVETALQHYLKRISTQVKVHQAILFGSYAQDNYWPGSDIDIAIIADDLSRPIPASQEK
ncbi:hypothetical protein E6H18_10490 [Candidatus Bathyarchaeota archaeon]|nr:MAG: hypothetical protein E6H18_10490 [Candidatus Bathyarchaeota archaeon]